MDVKGRGRSAAVLVAVWGAVLLAAAVANGPSAKAGPFWHGWRWGHGRVAEEPTELPTAGSWYWMRSPEQEQRVVANLYNRYCLRCHAIDGRGVWDIPDVPDFTNARWQAHRSDGQFARAIIEGRGAVMPPFRGTLTLEEAWALARYIRTFVPGQEASRPDTGTKDKAGEAAPSPTPVKPPTK